jgi:hypothetical protein
MMSASSMQHTRSLGSECRSFLPCRSIVMLTSQALFLGLVIGISGLLRYLDGAATVLRVRQAFSMTGLALLDLCESHCDFLIRAN